MTRARVQQQQPVITIGFRRFRVIGTGQINSDGCAWVIVESIDTGIQLEYYLEVTW